MIIRAATNEDWTAIWPFLREIVRAGETYSYDRDLPEDAARALWVQAPPARTVVAVDDGGAVLGTAKFSPNHGGGAAHVATASFMVDPAAAGRGVGRALGDHVLEQARTDGFRAMQFNAVVETNVGAVALWRSLGLEVMTTLPEAFRLPDGRYVGLHVMYRLL